MIRLATLGTIEATSSDSATGDKLTRQSKLIALLTYLAVEGSGRAVSLDSVCDVFWSDAAPARARRALNQLLHTGRQSFGVAAVVRVGSGLAIDPGSLVCDAGELLHGDVDGSWVLEHYRGELLPGVRLRGAAAFDDWLDRTRTRLRVRAVEVLINDATDADAIVTLQYAQRALELDPYSEQAAQLAIGALAAVRGRADAWRFFEEYRARLRDDLDLNVPASVTQLAAHVCSEPPPAPAATSAPPTPVAPPPGASQPVRGGPAVPRPIGAARRVTVAALGVLALTVAVARWIHPDLALATSPIEPSAHLILGRLEQGRVVAHHCRA